MTYERIDILEREECYALLRQQRLGRVAVALTDELVILPVYYALFDDDVIFRTSSGTKLNAALLQTKVAFEVDHDDPSWSVLVTGHAQDIRDAAEGAAARARLGDRWPSGQRECIVRIQAEKVTGRRLRALNPSQYDAR